MSYSVHDCQKWIEQNRDADPELFAHRLEKLLKTQERRAFLGDSVKSLLTILFVIMLCGLGFYGLSILDTDFREKRALNTAVLQCQEKCGVSLEVERKKLQAKDAELQEAKNSRKILDDHVGAIVDACRTQKRGGVDVK